MSSPPSGRPGRGHDGWLVHPQEAVAQAFPGAFAARADRRSRPDRLHLLRIDPARQARRGPHRDAGGGSAAMEGSAIRPGEVHLPGLREDQPGPGAVPCAAARLRRAEPSRHGAVREVRATPAAQSAIGALRREGVDLSLSTLADQVGGCAALLRPLYDLIRAHVLASGRVHGDDTTVPVLAKDRP